MAAFKLLLMVSFTLILVAIVITPVPFQEQQLN